MIAKTKFQKEIVRVNNSLPLITKAQSDWAFLNCLDHYAFRMKSGKITCLDCAHSWKSKSNESWHDELTEKACPNCNAKITVRSTQAKKADDYTYFTILTVHKGYQVVRNFKVSGRYFSGMESVKEYSLKKGEKDENYIRPKAYRDIQELSRFYIAENGKFELIGSVPSSNWYTSNWSWSLELRSRASVRHHYISTKFIYPRVKLLPIVERNGCTKDFHGFAPAVLIEKILTCSRSETLLKANQIKLLAYSIQNESRMNHRWDSIKICLRRGYIVEHPGDWYDHLNSLEELNLDIKSPKWICPDNFSLEHSRLTARVQRKRDKEKAEKKLANMKRFEEEYAKSKEKFFGIHHSYDGGRIVIETMKSVEQVKYESTILKHCAYTNNYFEKDNSVLFSARVDGEIMETIEISLIDFRIKQSRGFFNKESKHHKRIVEYAKDVADTVNHIVKPKSKPRRRKIKIQEQMSA